MIINGKKRTLFATFFFILVAISCGKTSDTVRDDAIESANILLTKSKCNEAVVILLGAGSYPKHAKFVQTLASAYACRAGYSTPVFYGTNLPKLAASTEQLLGSLTKFSTSVITSPTHYSYVNLQVAIDTLLYAGEVVEPTSDERKLVFSLEEMTDMNIQALYMILTQLGKYIFYYGNADPTLGRKGTGSEANGNPNNLTNGCFYNYNFTDPLGPLQLAVDAARASNTLGSCTTTATGHAALLPLPEAKTVTRMCQGVVLFNQFLDIILNTDLPSGAGDLSSLQDTFENILSSLPEGYGNIALVRSQGECETVYGVETENDRLQFYYFFIFEKMFI